MTSEVKMREAFHEWAAGKGHDVAHTYDTDRSHWLYLNPMTADLFACWQAASLAAIEAARVEARAKALEEAAKACEQMHDEDRPGDYAWTVRSLAKEAPIRAAASGDREGESR